MNVSVINYSQLPGVMVGPQGYESSNRRKVFDVVMSFRGDIIPTPEEILNRIALEDKVLYQDSRDVFNAEAIRTSMEVEIRVLDAEQSVWDELLLSFCNILHIKNTIVRVTRITEMGSTLLIPQICNDTVIGLLPSPDSTVYPVTDSPVQASKGRIFTVTSVNRTTGERKLHSTYNFFHVAVEAAKQFSHNNDNYEFVVNEVMTTDVEIKDSRSQD